MNDLLARNVRRLAAACLAGFAVLVAATFYWGVVRADELAARPDNVRRIAFDRRIRRGRILDRTGRVLAETVAQAGEDGVAEPVRVYPVPAMAPVTGYQTWRYGAGARPGVTYGAGGAEAAYDVALRGTLGITPGQLFASRVLSRPQVGHDVVLTVDADLQQLAADLIGEREGAVVVLDVEDGAVRALVSLPTFDPAALDAGREAGDMLVRATQGLYEPGSVWKVVTLAAALSEGLVRLDDVVRDGDAVEYFDGFPVACDNNPPDRVEFDMAHAFGWSCNVTFARLGVGLGRDRYADYARRFGLGEAPPFPLPVTAGSLSADGEMPNPELASAAFGQGELQVTPMQMALVTAAVAGDGSVPKPYLLADVPGIRWRRIADERGVWHRAVSAGTAAEVRRAMVTAAVDGYASGAREAAGVSLGGKTGTAETPGGAPHSWFVGFAPAERPIVAVAVLVVHGGSGSSVAAPIGGRVLARAVELEAAHAGE